MPLERGPKTIAKLAEARVLLRAAYDALSTHRHNERGPHPSFQTAARHVRRAQRNIQRARTEVE